MLVGAWVGACGEAPVEEGEGSGESGEPPPGPPQLVDLDGEALPELLELPADRSEDLRFGVADLLADTRVELDGDAQLPGGGAPAWIDAEAGQLHLPLGGALVEGRHELALVHAVGGELLRSASVAIEVVASSPGLLSASFVQEPVGTGDRLIGAGQGVEVPLGLVDDASGVVEVWSGAWGAASFELELPSLGLDQDPGDPRVWSSVELGVASSGEVRWVIAAWFDGAHERAFARAAEVSGPGELIGESGPDVELWSLDDPELRERLGPHEYAALHGLGLVGRSLVVEIEARRNLEAPSPGDRLLAVRELIGLDTVLDPLVLRGSGGADLDLAGDARRLQGLDPGPRLGLRLDQAFAQQLTIAQNGLPRVDERAFAVLDAIPTDTQWMRSVDGALGSRHVFALGLDPARVTVLRGLESFVEAASEGETGEDADDEPPFGGAETLELPAAPSAAPSLASLGGVPILLVPQGPDAEVIALRSTGAEVVLEPIAELRCEALRLSPPSADGVADTLPLACLREGSLEIGALGVD